jgi:hypothetical protein
MHSAWGPYPDTVLHFPDVGLAVDLRRSITPEIRAALSRLGFEGPFAIVTASNPGGRPLQPAENQRLARVLDRVVSQRFPTARRAHGAATSGLHLEPGWAIPAPLKTARDLAAQFSQDALFWYNGGQFLIVPVGAAGPVLPLPPG